MLTGVVSGIWLTLWPFAIGLRSMREKSDSTMMAAFWPSAVSSTNLCTVVVSSDGCTTSIVFWFGAMGEIPEAAINVGSPLVRHQSFLYFIQYSFRSQLYTGRRKTFCDDLKSQWYSCHLMSAPAEYKADNIAVRRLHVSLLR